MTTAAGLANTPETPEDFDRWSFHLKANVDDIAQALAAQGQFVSPSLPIYPFLPVDPQTWLERVSSVLGEICGATGVQEGDVENVDLADSRERQRWANQIFTEIRAARDALQI